MMSSTCDTFTPMTATLTPPEVLPQLSTSGPAKRPPAGMTIGTGGACEFCGHPNSIHNYQGHCVLGAGTPDRCVCDGTVEGTR